MLLLCFFVAFCQKLLSETFLKNSQMHFFVRVRIPFWLVLLANFVNEWLKEQSHDNSLWVDPFQWWIRSKLRFTNSFFLNYKKSPVFNRRYYKHGNSRCKTGFSELEDSAKTCRQIGQCGWVFLQRLWHHGVKFLIVH
jgi:hypothetical protein